jgi:glucose/arabinose dehydrogenase
VTLGQRNIQGAALHPVSGALWTVEHGPAGGDELNLIEPGANYGWPLASYGINYNGTEIGDGRAAHAPDFVEPVYYWDPVIAPGGMVFYTMPQGDEMFPEWSGDLLIAGLRAGAVVRLGSRTAASRRRNASRAASAGSAMWPSTAMARCCLSPTRPMAGSTR